MRYEVMRLKKVCAVTGLSRTTIYELMREGKFPHAIELGPRMVGWVGEDINNWIVSKINKSNEKRRLKLLVSTKTAVVNKDENNRGVR